MMNPRNSHLLGNAPAMRRGSAGTPAPRMAPPQKFGWFTAILIWTYIAVLCLRWDWLNPEAQTGDPFSIAAISNAYAANPTLRTLKLVLLFFAATIVVRNFNQSIAIIKNLNKGFLFFLVLVPISTIWSISPPDTMTRFVGVVTLVTICLACTVSSWSIRTLIGILRPLTTVMILASLAVGLYLPEWVVEHEESLKGAWHGLVESKNAFGPLCGLGTILWAHAMFFDKSPVWRALPLMLISFTCLVLSHSSTSLLACLFSLLFLSLMVGLPTGGRRMMPYLVVTFASIVLIYGLAVLRLLPGLDLLFAPIAAITGKDTTFTNRSNIWEIIKGHIAQSPLVGTGYGAYWTGPNPASPSFSFVSLMGFYPFECHNGYLEIVNDLGYVGLICLLMFLYYYVKECIILMRTFRKEAALLLALFFQQALLNLSESTWLDVNVPFLFSTMTLATFSLARMRMEQMRLQQPRQMAPRGR